MSCNCQKCFYDFVIGSPTVVQINALLEPSTDYLWELTDGFGNIYHSEFTTNADGIGSLNMSALPDGFANAGQAPLTIKVKETSDDCDYVPFAIIQHYESIVMDFKAGSGVKNWVACLIPGTTMTPTLEMPENFAGTTASGHTVLTWDAVTNATGYIVKKNGVAVYTGPLLTFDATELTNGTTYGFTVVATADGYNNSPAASINVTPAGDPITGYFLIETDGDTPTEVEILDGTPFSITDGQDYSITFPENGWLKVFEPSTQPEKTKNIDPVFGVDAFGPSGTFAVGAITGAFRGYISNYQTGPATIAFNQ